MNLLPVKKSEVSEVNPDTLVLFGGTKQGKTTLVANLEDNLILDLESGSKYYECLAIDVPKVAEENDLKPWNVIKGTLVELKAYKEQHGKNKYKYITVDTAGVLEDMTMPYAVALYKAEPRNKNFKGDNIKGVPNGAGWGFIRDAFFNTLASLKMYCDTLIIVAHTKDKTIHRRGNELEATDIDVSGKMSQMLAAKVEAIGLVYRKKNQTIVSFGSGEQIASGARPEHLREQELVLAESDDDGNMTYHWDKIFKE